MNKKKNTLAQTERGVVRAGFGVDPVKAAGGGEWEAERGVREAWRPWMTSPPPKAMM